MNSLSDTKKKRILKLLENISSDVCALHKKQARQSHHKQLLKDHADLVAHYRRFKSPRRIFGRFIDRAKGKFYYETEYFIGEIIARQEKFNNEVIDYLEKLEKEVKTLKRRKK